MLTAFLDAITNLSPKPFLLGGYILFCIAFTVRVFQSWHRTLRPSQKTKKTIEQKFTGTAALRISTKAYTNFEPSGDVRGLCPWVIVPVGELEQHGFHIEPSSDERNIGKPVAGTGSGRRATSMMDPMFH